MKIGITERGDAALHYAELAPKLASVDGAILITKNPQLLVERFGIDQLISLPVVVHCTITGMGFSMIEPGVLNPNKTLEAYQSLEAHLGPMRTVLRVDPVFPTERGIEKAKWVLEHAKGRVRMSFFDAYPHVLDRFDKIDPRLRSALTEIYQGELNAPLSLRKRYLEELEDYIHSNIEVCGEPGIACTGCVSQFDLDALNLKGTSKGKSKQRSACACLAAKTELLTHRGQCGHRCAYCYWK